MTNKNEMPAVRKRYYPKYPAPYYSAVFRDSFTHGAQLLYRFDCIYKDSRKAGYFSIPIEKFFEYFEELLDQPQAKDEVKVTSVEEAVKELIHELDYRKTPAIKNFNNGTLWQSCYDDLHIKAQKLVDAIENTDVIKTCPNCKLNYFSLLTDPTKFCSPDCEAESEGVKVPCVGANCEGCNCKKEKHKSLWKDVSEEPNSPQVITDGENFRTLCFFNNGQFEVAGSHVPKTEINGSVTIKRKYVANVKKYLELTDFVNAFEQLQRDVEDIKRKIK